MPKKLLNSPVFLLTSVTTIAAFAISLSPKTQSIVEAAADFTSPRAMAVSQQWTVTKVSDGDSITVRQTTGQEMKIRLCGIDAPELAQPLGKKSRDALRSLITSSKNQVMVSPVETDRYGRTVAEVFIAVAGGEKFLNQEQLSSGNAFLYKQYAARCPNKIALENAEAIAQSKKLGVWNGNYQRPWDYRRQQRNR